MSSTVLDIGYSKMNAVRSLTASKGERGKAKSSIQQKVKCFNRRTWAHGGGSDLTPPPGKQD